MATALQVFRESLLLLTVLDPDEQVTAAQAESCIVSLNNMMARWEENGIVVGYTPITNPAQTITVSSGKLETVVYNLAARMAAQFGKVLGPGVLEYAASLYEILVNQSQKTTGASTAKDFVMAAFRLVRPKIQYYFEDGIESLNAMIQQMQANGPNLWRQTEGVLFLNVGQQSYLLGSAEATNVDDLAETYLPAGAANGANSIVVASTTTLNAADRIGIELSTGIRHWTTITTIVGLTVGLAAPLVAAAAINASVYSYTTKLPRPVRITNADRRVGYPYPLGYPNGYPNDVSLEIVSKQEYSDQPNKSSRGKTNIVNYNPQLTLGVFSVWPTADSVRDQIRFTYERSFQTVTSATTAFDWPVEWNEAIKYQLAARLAVEYDRLDKLQVLKPMADELLAGVLGFDQEYASVTFQPEYRR